MGMGSEVFILITQTSCHGNPTCTTVSGSCHWRSVEVKMQIQMQLQKGEQKGRRI